MSCFNLFSSCIPKPPSRTINTTKSKSAPFAEEEEETVDCLDSPEKDRELYFDLPELEETESTQSESPRSQGRVQLAGPLNDVWKFIFELIILSWLPLNQRKRIKNDDTENADALGTEPAIVV